MSNKPNSIIDKILIMTDHDKLLEILAILGAFLVAYETLKFLINVISPLNRLWLKFLRFAVEYVNILSFRRSEISFTVTGTVNAIVNSLKPYLPRHWLNGVSIKWIRNGNSARIENGQLVILMKPAASIEQTIMYALWRCFESSIFPNGRAVIKGHDSSTLSLVLARTGLVRTNSHILKEFDEQFVVNASDQNLIDRNKYVDLMKLNEVGFLMGPFLREVDRVVVQLSLAGRSSETGESIAIILDHLLKFLPILRNNLDDEDWSCNTAHGSYGILLVSRPQESRPSVNAYVERVRSKIDRGVERIYIIGREAEREFVNTVIRKILEIRQLQGIEEFKLFKDYRGDSGGICILVGVDPVMHKLAPSMRDSRPAERRVEPVPTLASIAETPRVIDGDVERFEKAIKDIIVALSDYEEEWINIARIGQRLRELEPEFDPTKYGGGNFRNLAALIKSLPSLSTYERKDLAGTTILVKAKDSEGNDHFEEDLRGARYQVFELISS